MSANKESDERVVVVTGGGNGIGRAISRLFAERGCTVVIADPADEAAAVANELAADGRARSAPTDVTSVDDVESLFEMVAAEFGRLDVLVNNAGVFQEPEPTASQSIDAWQRVIDVHLRGTYLCSKVAAPLLQERPEAAVVNLSSVAGFRAFPYRTAYGPAKSAINNLTRVLAVEWAEAGVRVNAVAPGYVHTVRNEERIEAGTFDPDPIRTRTPAGRLGEPAEIAEAAYFLASPRARYVTGAVLPVDGGWSAYGYV